MSRRYSGVIDALVTVGYLGRSPVAPGSLGAIPAVLVAWLLQDASWFIWTAGLAIGSLVSVRLGDLYLRGLPPSGQNPEHHRDPQEVVLDELLGCSIAMAFVPFEPWWVLAAYALFRLFDIWKPGPIRWFDRRVSGGLGIMGDDILAGLLAGGLLALLRLVFRGAFAAG